MDTGVLDKSGILGTDVGSGEVQYITPYAARLYRHPEYNFNTRHHQLARAEWFEAMKKQHRDEILAAAATYFD